MKTSFFDNNNINNSISSNNNNNLSSGLSEGDNTNFKSNKIKTIIYSDSDPLPMYSHSQANLVTIDNNFIIVNNSLQ